MAVKKLLKPKTTQNTPLKQSTAARGRKLEQITEERPSPVQRVEEQKKRTRNAKQVEMRRSQMTKSYLEKEVEEQGKALQQLKKQLEKRDEELLRVKQEALEKVTFLEYEIAVLRKENVILNEKLIQQQQQ